MRKMKKVAVMCLTAAMTMSLLAGCGGAKKDTDGSTSETEVTTEVSTEEETTEATTEEATTEEELGVSDGDKVININFDDKDTDGFHTYTNGGNEEMTLVYSHIGKRTINRVPISGRDTTWIVPE